MSSFFGFVGVVELTLSRMAVKGNLKSVLFLRKPLDLRGFWYNMCMLICPLCNSEFEKLFPRQTHCCQLREFKCDVCSKPFQRVCDGELNQKAHKLCSIACFQKASTSWQAKIAECKICGKDFFANTVVETYCHQTQPASCTICGELFLRNCGKQVKTRCNAHRESRVKKCRSCGEEFIADKSAYYCRKEVLKKCVNCENLVKTKCGEIRNTCSEKCRHAWIATLARESKESRQLSKSCSRCGDAFRGTTQRTYCYGEKTVACLICERDFTTICDKTYSHICSKLCMALVSSTKMTPEKARAIHNLESWAAAFKKKHRRRPQREDFRREFDVNVANKFLSPHIKLKTKKGYWLEHYVLSFLSEEYPELRVLERDRSIINGSPRNRLEMDVYLPDLKLAFEVQDFTSHSKISDIEDSRWKIPKRGPVYHELKRSLAKEQLDVELIDLWEDEILDGSYKEIVKAAIAKSLDQP